MRKRLLCIVMSVTVVLNLFSTIPVKAQTNDVSFNVAALESILNGDRQFVIDTLIGDNYKTDFSTNPHAAVNHVADEKTMMDNALSQYRNKDDPNYSGAYKAAVDIMEIAYEGDDYTQDILDFVLEFAADITGFFGLDAESTIRDLTKSVGELKYESVIKEVLSGDYTTSDGVTLSSKEMQYEELEHLVSNVKKVNNFAKNLKTIMSSDFISEEAYMNRLDYYENYMIPYAKSYSEAANAVIADLGGSTDETSKRMVAVLAGMVHMMKYETNNVQVKSDIINYAPDAFIEAEALKLIGAAGKLTGTACTTLSAYMYINDIAMQTKSLKGVLDRTARNAPHDMANVLERYSDAIGEAGNAKLMAYETLMKYIRDEGVVNTLVEEAGEAIATKVTKKIENKIGKKLSETKAGIAKTTLTSVLSKATSYVGVSGWCVDKATNFKTTCKKTYELKYLEKVIKEAVDTYYRDLAVYSSFKTDEYAKNVLYDLQFIQKLRLRGEAIAYNMVVSQTNSMLGKLLGGIYATPSETIVESLTASYQQRVNAFIGASIVPYSTEALTIKKGEKATILYNNNGLIASCSNATMAYGIAELDQRVLNGITVEAGGELTIALNSKGAYIPYVKNNGGNIYINSVGEVTEITTNSGTTTLGPAMSYVPGIYFGGGTLTSRDIEMLNCDMLVSTGGTATIEIPVTTKLTDVAGRINGKTVYLTGNSNGGGGVIQNLYLCGDKTQTMRNTIGTVNIIYDNPNNVIQDGTVKVSGKLKNIDTKIKNAKNTVLLDGASIDGDYYKQDITIAGAISEDFVEYDGVVYVKDTASFGSIKANNILYQTGGALKANGEITLTGDAIFTNANIGSIDICGNKPQSINGTITVGDYKNNNTKGLTIANKINVTGKALSVKAPTSGGNNVTLIDGGSFTEGIFYGDITLGTLSGSIPKMPKINGSVYINGTINQTQNDTIYKALTMQGGTLNIKDCNLVVKNKFSLNAGTVNLTNADFECNTYSSSSTMNIDENSTFRPKSDFVNSGTVSSVGTVETIGDITNSGTFKTDKLILNGKNAQTVSAGTIITNDFDNQNSRGVTLSGNINVSRIALSTKAPSGSGTVTLVGDGNFGGVKYNGNINLGTLTGAIPDMSNINGAVTITGNITQTETDNLMRALSINGGNLTVKDCTLSLRNKLTLNSGSITLQNAVLNCKGCLVSAAKINVDKTSRLEIDSEFVNSGTVSSTGTVKVNGNISNSGTFTTDKLVISANSDRTVSGNNITTNTFEATGNKAIALSNNINVTEDYKIGNVKIDVTMLKRLESIEITNKTALYDGLQLSGKNLTISDNAYVRCSGNLNVSGGNLVVKDNSVLEVRKRADLSNVNITLGNNSKIVFSSRVNISGTNANSITVDETSELTSKNLLSISGAIKCVFDGELVLGGDTMLTSTSFSGIGKAFLFGDLYTTSTTNLLIDRFNICGRFAQRINGNNLMFNNLTISNSSPEGVTFDTAYYNGELINDNTVINGTLTKSEEESAE